MKKIIIGIAVVIVVGGIIFLVIVWKRPQAGTVGTTVPASGTSSPAAPVVPITNIVLDRSTYQVALARAEQWQPDAALFKMTSQDATGNAWDFVFTSPTNKGKGFEIVANGQNITSAQAINISEGGTALPANIISPDQAIAIARATPGYSNAIIVSVEILYNALAHQWYWGVTTSNGLTLTINAVQSE